MTAIHPDCQMPDSAEPCLGYQELLATNERNVTILNRIAAALNTEETGEALVEIAKNAHRAELELAARDQYDGRANGEIWTV